MPRRSSFHNAPASAAAEKNPYDGQASAISAGKTSYASHCAACHGVTAEGTGNVPPLAHGALQGVPDGSIFWYITKGGLENGMPSWAALPAEERWQLVTFIKSMSASADEKRTRPCTRGIRCTRNFQRSATRNRRSRIIATRSRERCATSRSKTFLSLTPRNLR